MSGVWRALTGLVSLHEHAVHGRYNLARLALLLGGGGRWVDHRSGGELHTTPLHAASYNGHLALVRLLVEQYGADTAAQTADGWTALHCAASNGYLPVVRYLLEDCPRPCATTAESKEGWTALHCAAAHGFLPVVKYLIEKRGMDADVQTYAGWSALHWAAAQGYLAVVRYLVLAAPTPVDRTAIDHTGNSVLHVAARQGQTTVVAFLLGDDPRASRSHSGASGADAASAAPAAAVAASDDVLAQELSPTLHAAAAGVSTIVEAVPAEPAAAGPDGVDAPAVVDEAALASSPAHPLLSDAFVCLRNDKGASAFLLACLRGKLSVAELLVARLGRDSFKLRDLQQAHDAHQGAARKPGAFLNHQLITYLRNWMQEAQYAEQFAEQQQAQGAEDEDVETMRMSDAIGGANPERIDEGDEQEEDSDAEDDDNDDEEEDADEDRPGASGGGAYDSRITRALEALDNAHLARSPISGNEVEAAGSGVGPAAAASVAAASARSYELEADIPLAASQMEQQRARLATALGSNKHMVTAGDEEAVVSDAFASADAAVAAEASNAPRRLPPFPVASSAP